MILHPKSKPTKFIPEFEGLRGLLAAWVIFGHILLFSGFSYEDGWFGVVFSPVLGVYTFMMLSGFVIVAALDGRPVGWLEFMTRRFWRIYPTYAFCLSLAIVLMPISTVVSSAPALSEFGPENLERLQEVSQHFGLYLAADSTLLQCLLPRAWFPAAAESFLVPTWSLTLEWLFYLVAPILVLAIRRNVILTATTLISVALFLATAGPWLTTHFNASFHLANFFHFLTGIGTYYAWKHIPLSNPRWGAKLAALTCVAVSFLLLGLPYKIWIGVVILIFYRRFLQAPLAILELPRKLLNSAAVQFLGRISYVSYLLHWVVLEITLFWLLLWIPSLENRHLLAACCTAIVFPATYLFSWAIHCRLEAPLMRMHLGNPHSQWTAKKA